MMQVKGWMMFKGKSKHNEGLRTLNFLIYNKTKPLLLSAVSDK